MTISYNWLTEYIKSDLTPEETSKILTDIGLEVEGFEKHETIKGGLDGVVVGEVLTCTQHPDADRLKLTTVNVGRDKPLQIVCGAPNVDAGQKVMVATVGTVLYPDGDDKEFKIGEAKIRGVESFGMICSEVELGIGNDQDGIIELESDAVVGTPASEVYNIQADYLITIGLTPNRADGASHYGVARDLAAWLESNNKKYELTLPSVEKFAVDSHDRKTEIEVQNSKGAPRYAGVTLTNIKVGPSPDWLQKHLKAIGLVPRNNVVDITNFILHEVGQPLHAFDADKIEGGKIVVRNSKEGTKFKTLDEVERTLSDEDLMICSTKEPLCIAGVLGGEDSGVSDSTTSVFIESAYFDPVHVRKTARRHGLNTDASFRFERGTDPDIVIYAAKRAALLMKELAGGTISSEIIDVYPTKVEPYRFELSLPYMKRLLGIEIAEQKVRKILASLEIEVEKEKDGILSVVVPPYRVDVRRQADLIEDILRIYGYDQIETPLHVNSTISYAPNPDKEKLTNLVADMLAAKGFAEAMNNSLTKASYYEGLKSYKLENCVEMLNPLSIDLNVMRQTLLFGILESIELNIHRRNNDLKFFEFGNCYKFDAKKKEKGGLAPYSESARLAIAITGMDSQPSWNNQPKQTDFHQLRAILEQILRRFGIDIYSLQTKTLKSDLYADALQINLRGQEFAHIGAVGKDLCKQFDIKSGVYYLEMDFGLLMEATKKHEVMTEELSKFHEVERDLAMLIDQDVTFADLRRLAFSTERKLLKEVTLFDVYEGDKLPEGKKSYALRFILEDKDKTLTDKVIDKVMNSLIVRFEKECKAQIRTQ